MSHSEHLDNAASVTAKCAVITCSDTRDESSDASGSFIRQTLGDAGHEVVLYRVIPDEPAQITAVLHEAIREEVDVIITNGGTGISKRDNTFETLSAMIERPLTGFGELFRMLSYEDIGSASMLSRATAGIISNVFVFSLPGSTGAVHLAMEKLIMPQIRHLVSEVRR